MRILLLIKTNHPDQSNPKYYAQRRWFFSKTSWKKPILLLKCLVRPWSGRPVLTFGKRPKIMTLYILEVHLNFLWWCASKPRKQRFQNYVPFESVIFLGREIQYETICPVDLDMFLSIITMMMMIITVHLRATSLQRPFFFGSAFELSLMVCE